MIYEIYKNVRNSSWRCLLECGINSLPVNLSQICKYYGIRIVKNSFLKENRLMTNEKAKNMFINGQWYIIVDDSDYITVQRYSIAHEIGHILMGNDISEYEAERFAINILAPACVLWGLNLHTAKDISEVCNISMRASHIRAERMEVLYKRNKFLTSPLERQVFEQFSGFLEFQKEISASEQIESGEIY